MPKKDSYIVEQINQNHLSAIEISMFEMVTYKRVLLLTTGCIAKAVVEVAFRLLRGLCLFDALKIW